MREKAIGIVGGIGPEATVDLFKKILKATPARTDQEHIRILIDCNPKIPDRAKAILAGGEDPTSALIRTAQNLEGAGADLLLVACNAAHYYYPEIANRVSIPVLHMIEETADYCRRKFRKVEALGLLAQSSTFALGLYDQAFEKVNKKIISPSRKDREIVSRCIYAIKGGELGKKVKERLRRVGGELISGGAGAVIMGCTEIPLILADEDLPVPLIDPTRVYAQAAVAWVRGKHRKP